MTLSQFVPIFSEWYVPYLPWGTGTPVWESIICSVLLVQFHLQKNASQLLNKFININNINASFYSYVHTGSCTLPYLSWLWLHVLLNLKKIIEKTVDPIQVLTTDFYYKAVERF